MTSSSTGFRPLKSVFSKRSPDLGCTTNGNVSADGKYLWLSGRVDDVVYRVDTASGAVDKVKVDREPHGLAVLPLPGQYSLGHTGNMC